MQVKWLMYASKSILENRGKKNEKAYSTRADVRYNRSRYRYRKQFHGDIKASLCLLLHSRDSELFVIVFAENIIYERSSYP